MEDKIISLEEMKNMSIDRIIELYRNGYILESSDRQITGNIESMNPNTISIVYVRGYEQVGLKMTVDLLIKNNEDAALVVKFKFYSTDATPIYLGSHVACIQPYSIPQNANGCTKVRVADLPLKDPYRVYVFRCADTSNCAVPSCVRFDEILWDSTCTGEVNVWGGIVPPITEFPPAGVIKCSGGLLDMSVDCASCTPSWSCVKDAYNNNTGYKYDSCTQQTVLDLSLCPLPPTVKDSKISITTDSPSPFSKEQVVRFYGTLESATFSVPCACYPNIPGADVLLTIRVGGAKVVEEHLTTLPGEAEPNFIYDWTVPPTIAGVDTSGMSVAVTVAFSQTAQWKSATATANYAVAGASCTDITVTASKTSANAGEHITITALTKPTTASFPVIIKVDGQRLGTGCTTLPAPSLVPVTQIQQRMPLARSPEGILKASNIQTLQNTITLLNVPASVMAGQTIEFQIRYSLNVDWFGEWVRYRICSGGVEIGNKITLHFGSTSGITSVKATIPAGATGTISIKAEVTINELSRTCGDPDVIASTPPVNITISTPLNIMSIVDPPTTVIAGQTVDIRLSYTLHVSWWGEWVRFRVCTSAGTELGSNIELLFGDSSGIITVSTAIPSGATGEITIKGEVTTNELNKNCGDAGVFATTTLRTIPIVTQASGTISLIDLPAAVRAGQAVDFKVSYNLAVSWWGEWVRFRVCSGTTEIGKVIKLLFGTTADVITINSVIPTTATGTLSIKAEVTLDELNATCGAAVLASSSVANIPISIAQAGTCQITWDTTGSSSGVHYVTAEVLGQCSTVTPLEIILVAPPAPCTSISIGIDRPSPIVGDVVVLTAIAQPLLSPLNVTFKADGKTIGSGCVTSAGRCTTSWNTAGLSPGTYRLIATVEGQCSSPPLDINLASTVATCTSITTPSASPPTATIGSTVTLIANAQPTTTVFPVNFKDQNNVTLGTVNTENGVATLRWNTAEKTAGTYQIKASVGAQCVSPAAVMVTLTPPVACTSISTVTASPTTTTIGQVVTLSATAQPTTAVFTVDFKDQNNNIIGSANTISGLATYQWNTSGKTAGNYQIKAYTGTCVSATATTVTLNPAVTCTSITTPTATPTTVTIGGTVKLEATVQPTAAIFSVAFKDQNNVTLGTANTLSGKATLNWSTAGKDAGTYQIKAYADSCVSTDAVSVTVSEPTTACTSVTIPVATPTTVVVGEVVTLSVTAQPTTAVFTVDFKDQNGNLIGSKNTVDGIASYVWSTGTAPTGTYNIKAYVGAQCLSTGPVTVTISPTAITCTSVTTPIALPSTVTVGQILALRALVQPTTTIFTVDFKDQNNNIIGSANTISGVATYNWNTTGKAPGNYHVKAYIGAQCVSESAVTVTISGTGGVGSLTFIITAAGQPLAGAEITVDGVSRGMTGDNGKLPSPVVGLTLGITHVYTVTKAGYTTKSGSKLLNTDETITIDMTPPAAEGMGMAIAMVGVAAAAFLVMRARKPAAPPKE